MNVSKIFEKLNLAIAELAGKNKFTAVDFGILKTMLMLSAVDGDVSPAEIMKFRDVAEACAGCNEGSLDGLWESALRSAGYLLLKRKLVNDETLVALFVKEAEKDFTGALALEDSASCDRAFACLTAVAEVDGDYSDMERACIAALAKRVGEARDQAIAERYPRAAAFGK